MILDSHVYCFQPADHPAGYTSGAEHLKWLQSSHSRHHQPAWRVRNRIPASSAPLNPSGTRDLDRLPDVNFRADHECGRVVWTIDGEDYTKQFYPPNLRNLEFTPHSLIAEMDYAGVEIALLHTDPSLVRDPAFLSSCVNLYPDRLQSMAPVDEWRIIEEMDTVIEELTSAIERYCLHAIKFFPSMASLNRASGPWDDGPLRPFWEAATALGVPIFFTLGTVPTTTEETSQAEHIDGYLEQLRILMLWMERYPQTACSLTHGFPYRLFFEKGKLTLPDAVWEPFENPNCHFEVCLPIRLGDLIDFPYREVWPALEQMADRIGAHRLMWGTDMPFQNRFCTYRQSCQWIEKYCTFLSPADLNMIMGDTAARVLGIP